jgi:hypothetical protein
VKAAAKVLLFSLTDKHFRSFVSCIRIFLVFRQHLATVIFIPTSKSYRAMDGIRPFPSFATMPGTYIGELTRFRRGNFFPLIKLKYWGSVGISPATGQYVCNLLGFITLKLSVIFLYISD